jgi:hypothetical protein
MTYWGGTRWVPDAPAPASPSIRPARRLAGAAIEGGLITLLLFGLIAGSTFAAKGGNGHGGGNHAAPATTCTVDGATVSASGLPTGEVLNFMVTDAGGTWGWVLGFTDTGSWSEPVPAANGPTTYEFASRTRGPNGAHYDVFATCSTE